MGAGGTRWESPETTGIITTVAGNGTAGYSGDGGLATDAQLNDPFAVAVDAAGDLFIADSLNSVIREVNATTRVISTVAGDYAAGLGYSGDGGPATAAQLWYPTGVAVDAAGDLFIADDFNSVVREVRAGIISTVAGNGTQGYNGGDGGPATDAELGSPANIAVDAAGDLFIADVGIYNNDIREVSPAGIITTVAGNGTEGYSGDGGPATAAELNFPVAIALDASGDLFIADALNQDVREVSPAGIISTVAGDGYFGYLGDGGPATEAELYDPYGIAVDAAGDLFIADSGNDVIREVTPSFVVTQAGTTTTLASSNSSSPFGEVVTFTATVGVVAPGTGSPTGMVTFWDGSTQLGTGILNAAGQATFTTADLSLGTHTITATYGGGANFTPSNSAALTQSVLSAQQETALIVNQVNTLVSAGVLSTADGNALAVKLNNAIANLNSGNTTAGVNQLDAFINQVNAFLKAGKLDGTDGQTLISDVDLAISAALDTTIS